MIIIIIKIIIIFITANHTRISKKLCPPFLLTGIVKLLIRLDPEGGYVPPRPKQMSISIMMHLRYGSFRNEEVNGITPEDLVSSILYFRGLSIRFTGISSINALFDQ